MWPSRNTQKDKHRMPPIKFEKRHVLTCFSNLIGGMRWILLAYLLDNRHMSFSVCAKPVLL